MTFLVKGKKNHKGVIFKKRAMVGSDPSSAASSTLNQLLYGNQETRHPNRVSQAPLHPRAEATDPVSGVSDAHTPLTVPARTARASMVPDMFTSLPPIRDLLITESSQIQEETIRECLPFLSGQGGGPSYNEHGVPNLDRKRHIQFLHKSLKRLPAPYVAADASRPWMFYWALNGLVTMGVDVSEYRQRVIDTARPIQNATGGFGGGNGQMSHLAPTYAITLSLAIVGGNEALAIIDRKAMWKWLGALKQPDGGFQMSVGGEEDIR